MATTPAKTSAGTRDPGEADALSAEEQAKILASDERDVAVVKTESAELKGKRVRAIPAVLTKNGDVGTTVQVTKANFLSKGIEQKTVTWDARRDNFTVLVGNGDNQLSEEAADFLTSNYPYSFEYMGG